MTIALWIVQILLALAFLLAGFMKVSQPIDNLKKNMGWVAHTTPPIVRLIGTLEILGGLGLILPAVTGILPWLTPVAAVGLVLTMIGAATVHIRRNSSKSNPSRCSRYDLGLVASGARRQGPCPTLGM